MGAGKKKQAGLVVGVIVKLLSFVLWLLLLPLKWAWKTFVALPCSTSPDAFEGLLVGHRGCRAIGDIPENTLRSFTYAIDHGAKAVELDCRLTKDKHLAVIHDETVDRTHTHTGRVADMSLQQLKQLNYKKIIPKNEKGKVATKVSSTATADVTPSLKEVVELVKKRNVKLFLEAKVWSDMDDYIERVLDIFKEDEDLYSTVCVISFNPLFLRRLSQRDGRIVTCFLYFEGFLSMSDWPWTVQMLGQAFVEVAYRFCPFLIKDAFGACMFGPWHIYICQAMREQYKKAGMGMYTWTVNNSDEMAFYLKRHGISSGTDCVFHD